MLYIPLWVCWLFTTTTYIYSITKLCQASEIPLPKSQELIEVQVKEKIYFLKYLIFSKVKIDFDSTSLVICKSLGKYLQII